MKNVRPWVSHNRAWIISGIIAITISFFGLNLTRVKEIAGDLVRILQGRKTVYYSFVDESHVTNRGGEVHGTNASNFAKGGCGDIYGFISIEDADVLHIPVPDELVHLDEGTVALCVTPKTDFQGKDNLSLFRIHQGDQDVSLKVGWEDEYDSKGPGLRLRLRLYEKDEKKGNPQLFSKDPLNWTEDDHYHLAGTWGADGMKLYIDGKPVNGELRGDHTYTKANFEDFKGGTFVINNADNDLDKCDKPTNSIVSNLQVSNYQMDDTKVKESYEVLHPGEKTVYYSLVNEEQVEKKKGTVYPTNVNHDNNFAKGGCGDISGFISRKKKEVIHIPVPPELVDLDKGTVALCVTPKTDFQGKYSLSLFRIHKGDQDVSLKVGWPDDPKPTRLRLRLRLRLKEGEDNPIVFSKKTLDWKANSHYHLAGTWGADGMKLYINGELEGEHTYSDADFEDFEDFKGGTFVINNDDNDLDKCDKPTNCIVSNLQVFNYQRNDKQVKERYDELHPTE